MPPSVGIGKLPRGTSRPFVATRSWMPLTWAWRRPEGQREPGNSEEMDRQESNGSTGRSRHAPDRRTLHCVSRRLVATLKQTRRRSSRFAEASPLGLLRCITSPIGVNMKRIAEYRPHNGPVDGMARIFADVKSTDDMIKMLPPELALRQSCCAPEDQGSSVLFSVSHAARCVACQGVRSHAVPFALVGLCLQPDPGPVLLNGAYEEVFHRRRAAN